MSQEKISIDERFWSKVNFLTPNGCWEWTARVDNRGYGRFKVDGKYKSAHRIGYKLAIGSIQEDLVIDHLCRNHSCVNPSHMELVTNGENVLRGVGLPALNAVKTHCKNGHPLEGDNLVKSYLKRGARMCRICRNTARMNSYRNEKHCHN